MSTYLMVLLDRLNLPIFTRVAMKPFNSETKKSSLGRKT